MAPVGLDLGPSTVAIVAEEGEARLLSFCRELKTDQGRKCRLQRKLDRQRRANNPENYDAKGRVKKGKKLWRESQGYKATRRRLAAHERKLAAHRKSLHGRLVHEIVRTGNTIITEKLSYKAWQKQYGKNVGTHAPGMFIEWLKRTVARTGGILQEVPTRSTKLSQYCHGCGNYVKKPLALRWHLCPCGIGPVQRDLYSAFLAVHLELRTLVPSIAQDIWESAETRLRAAMEDVMQRANAGEALPKAWAFPVLERVCLEVLEATSKSWVPVGGTEKRWPVDKNPLRFSQGVSVYCCRNIIMRRCIYYANDRNK